MYGSGTLNLKFTLQAEIEKKGYLNQTFCRRSDHFSYSISFFSISIHLSRSVYQLEPNTVQHIS